MKYYPINLNIKNKRCLVVGGGLVAERKVETLLKAGAKVVVVSPRLTTKLGKLSRKGRIENIARKYRKGDLKGAVLAFGATNDPKVNRRILQEARKEGELLLIRFFKKYKYNDIWLPSFLEEITYNFLANYNRPGENPIFL